MDSEGRDETQVICAALGAIYLLAFIALSVQTAKVTASDPTDPTVKLHRMHRDSLQAFNEGSADKFVYFREKDYSYYCTVCDSNVLGNSKHCMQCNRCTYEFDHHCYWINNDIGLHNYAAFLRMLAYLIVTLAA
mmetsp:Transcript_23221/g.28789  ORF Transcript_23221/g.28789 Transcript_23221/m.28789 type:complete len:134 (-) Transcript_23221:12-413(-)